MSVIKLNQRFYEYNLDQIVEKVGSYSRLICVFKDNAYGHGAKILAPIAKSKGVDFVAVKNEKEALELEPYFKNILILSHIPHGKENPRFIYALNDIKKLNLYAKNTNIHLKIDTGMHRNGILVEDLPFVSDLILENNLQVKGCFTHFLGADELDGSFFIQRKKFDLAKKFFNLNFKEKILMHSHNSFAFLRSNIIPEDEMCRIGLLQFGYGSEKLKKVLSLYAHKLSSRILKKGENLGYGGKFVADRDMKISTYDLGYADGLFRYNGDGVLKLAQQGNILGKMSMDSFFCEGDLEELCVFNDAKVWADYFNTIEYEILSKLHPDIERIII